MKTMERPTVEEPRDAATSSDTLADEARRGLRLLSLVVLALLVAGSIGAAAVTRRLVHDQEHRLLKERTGEVALVLSSATSSLQASLAAMGTAIDLTNASPAAFDRVAAPQLQAQSTVRAVALVRAGPGGDVVALSAGKALPAGQVVVGPRAQAVNRALTAPGLYTTPVFREGNDRIVGIAVGPPAAPPGTVLYRESALTPTPAVAASAPFSEVEVAFYAGPRADPSQLAIATGKAPLRGGTYTTVTKIGASPWLLVTKAKRPLVGSLAARLPWFVLLAGLIGALLVALLVEAVARRRDYAMALVDERTADLEAAQASLIRQERLAAVGQLASTVGHELRNPLGVITNSLYLIKNATASSADERLKRHLATAEREATAAKLIVTDLLDYAVPRDPIVASVDMTSLIDESFDVAPPPPGIAVSWSRPANRPTVSGDRDQLRQVLMNLITNAYDAMPDGGTLRVETATRDGRVDTTVSDSGQGMDDDTRRRAFEPFFTTKAKGVGLGLAATDRIVAAHGGTITVRSSLGEGATFVVDLPRATDAVSAPAPRP